MTYESIAAAMALGGEVEHHGWCADRVHLVHQLLPTLVLNPGWVPTSRRRCSSVSFRSPPPQSPAACSTRMQGGELPQHTRVEVVDVQRRVEPLARVAVATPIRVPHVIAHVRVRRI
jgi:hypothetical protein